MFSIGSRSWTHKVSAATRDYVTATRINLKRDYPAVFQFVHPCNQASVENDKCDVKTVLSWKCPNQEDHEWTMSIQEAIRTYNRNAKHSRDLDGR